MGAQPTVKHAMRVYSMRYVYAVSALCCQLECLFDVFEEIAGQIVRRWCKMLQGCQCQSGNHFELIDEDTYYTKSTKFGVLHEEVE